VTVAKWNTAASVSKKCLERRDDQLSACSPPSPQNDVIEHVDFQKLAGADKIAHHLIAASDAWDHYLDDLCSHLI